HVVLTLLPTPQTCFHDHACCCSALLWPAQLIAVRAAESTLEEMCQKEMRSCRGGQSAALCNVKETQQHSEEEVGAFTKFIEAMGFTAPLKYNKWIRKLHSGS
uniref:Uncharacterized protein n=1 Tax=Oryzias sinensis TaxID=183150 RepID=A0A8C7Y773_9TELE